MKNSFTPPPRKGKQALKGFKCLIVMLFISAISWAQSGQKWATGGNANGAGDFLGTTNNFSIDFKTNNTLKMVLGTDGTLKLINLAGNGTRMLQTDATGNLTPLLPGAANTFLSGNGTWANLPLSATSWSVVGNNMFAAITGNVGIGTNNPQYKLHVVGDAYISNNLFVGGGIIVTDQLKAAEYVTTGRLTADTIKMGLGRVIDGTTKVAGDLYIDPTRTLTAGGDIMANSKLTVAGNATFNGTLKATQSVLLDNNNTGFKLNSFTTGTVTTPVLSFARSVGSIYTFNPLPPCITASPGQAVGSGVVMDVVGALVTRDASGDHPTIMGFDGANHILEAGVGASNNNTGSFFINYYCGKDLGLCLNTSLGNGGGKVRVGKFLSAAEHVEIGSPQYGITTPGNVALDMNVHAGNAIKINTYNQGISAFELVNTGLNPVGTYFKILGNGKTQIGSQTQATGTTHANALLTVYGKVVATSCYVRTADWADYVFAPDYKMPNLYEIEKYYKENKHLEGIPSEKEVLENGIDVAEMNKLLLKKVEELTILMVQQQKEIDGLKAKIK